MAKDNRQILSAVRFKGTLYKPGMEDELSAALNQGELDRLMDKGALGGDFTSKAVADTEKTETKDDDKVEKKPAPKK